MFLSDMLRRRRLLLGRKPYEGCRWACYPRKRIAIVNHVTPATGMIAGNANYSSLTFDGDTVGYHIIGEAQTDYDGLFSASLEAGITDGTTLYHWTADGKGTYTVRVFVADTPHGVSGEAGTYPDNGFKSPNYYYKLGPKGSSAT